MIAFGSAVAAGMATTLGAIPIFFKRDFSPSFLQGGMGLSAGIMLTACFSSLIYPGIGMAEKLYPQHHFGFVLVLLGIALGYVGILWAHNRVPHEHLFKDPDVDVTKGLSRVSLIVLAIAIHNLPEGLAVGVGFGGTDLNNAMDLAIGIALQNIPEGLVVAFGLVSEGVSKPRAFKVSVLSGAVEPVAAIFGFFAAFFVAFLLPVLMGFAAGAMLFVVCQEMLPELFKNGHEKAATRGVLLGVILMLAVSEF